MKKQTEGFRMLTDPAVTVRHIDTPLTAVGYVSVAVTPPEDVRYRVFAAHK